MERLKLVFETDKKVDIYKVRDALEPVGLSYKSAIRERLDVVPEVPSIKGCCGGKRKIKSIDIPKPSMKDRLMLWSYKYISKCLFCAGIRIGTFVGIWLGIAFSSIFIIYKW